MKTDFLGEYDEFAIPLDFQTPIHVDVDNNALACASGRIIGVYSFVNESTELAHAKRRAEFTAKLANGDIVVDHGNVYLRTGSQYQEGRLVVTYEPMGAVVEPGPEKVTENGHSEPNKGLVAKVLSKVKGKRGRPKKNA